MKKILMSTVVLFLFSLSIILFQIACKKSAEAETPVVTAPLQVGKILYTKRNYQTYTTLGVFTANFDGTNETQINITGLPTATQSDIDNLTISPDGKTIFFTYSHSNGTQPTIYTLYSCNVDGTGLKIVKGGGTNTTGYILEQVY